MDPGIYIWMDAMSKSRKMKAPSCYPCGITLGQPVYHVFVVAVDAIVLLFPPFPIIPPLFSFISPCGERKLSWIARSL